MRSVSFSQQSVREVIDEFDRGELLIPEFQRPYVWKPSQAAKLVDSLFRGFPIGSLLIWNAPVEVQARRSRPRRNARAGRWLIDGQQRVTTLSWIAAGDQLEIAYNLETQEIRVANAATRKDPRWVRVSDVWNERAYRDIVRSRNLGDDQHKKLEVLKNTLFVSVATTEMNHHGFDDAVEAFSRLNSQGRRLSGADLESARVASKHAGFIRDEVVPLVEKLRSDGFGGLKVTHLFRACGAIARPDGRDRTPLQELSAREMKDAWKLLRQGLKLTKGLVQSEFGLNDMRLLRSGALLVPPIVVLGTARPRDRPVVELAGWIALAALFHRYSKAGETALDKDLRACHATDPVASLLRNLRGVTRGRLIAKEQDFRGTLVDQGALFAAYVACRETHAVDPFTRQRITHNKDVEHHHIFPRATFPVAQRREADVIANMAFIVKGSNVSIGAQQARDYLPTLTERARSSQCIPVERSLYPLGSYPRFLQARRKLIATAFNEAVRLRLPGRWLRERG